MNIFKEYHDIYGTIDIEGIKKDFKELFELIKPMREQLGRHKYVLDIYLQYFLEGANATNIYSVAMDAFEGFCCSELLCKVLQNSEDDVDHPLYKKIKELIESKPLLFLEDTTKRYLYFIDLFFDYAEHEIKEYSKFSLKAARREYDIVEFDQIYDQIGILLGSSDPLERLNELLKKCFLKVRIMDAFCQSLLNHLLGTLTYRDDETGKLIFQILMD